MTLNAASVTELAPAKINLALHVTGRRPDGYHLIESLVVFTAFGDRVSIRPAETDSFAVLGPFAPGVPVDADNLVVRARDALRTAFPDQARAPVAITLDKRLPVASGVGGGSSDAAAALRALARHWRIETPAHHLGDIGLGLGADLPMCLMACPLIARGIGEIIEPVQAFPALAMVLVNPAVAVSTPEVFRALAKRENPPLQPLPRDLDFDSMLGWLNASRNDLQAPGTGLAPQIGDVLTELRLSGAAFARMSGSGATCFGVYETAQAAARSADAIAGANPGWFVAATTSTR